MIKLAGEVGMGLLQGQAVGGGTSATMSFRCARLLRHIYPL